MDDEESEIDNAVTPAGYPGTAVFNIILAGAFCIAVALLPYWESSEGAGIVQRITNIIAFIDFDSSNHGAQFIQIFVLPILIATACVLSLSITLFMKPTVLARHVVAVLPIVAVVLIALYTLFTRGDVHIASISLIPLLFAWRVLARTPNSS